MISAGTLSEAVSRLQIETLAYRAVPDAEAMVPLYGDGKLIGMYTAVDIAALGGVTLVRRKNGTLVRAEVRRISLQTRPVLSSKGMVFRQHLANGHMVYALRGVRGS